MLCRMYVVQIQLNRHVLDHADCTAPTRKHELDHTDHDFSSLKDLDHQVGKSIIQIICLMCEVYVAIRNRRKNGIFYVRDRY